MKSDELLTEITCRFIIPRGGRILVKKPDGSFMHSWTNIAAGPDHAIWGGRADSLEFFNLKWALTIAPLYKAKVLVVYPPKRQP